MPEFPVALWITAIELPLLAGLFWLIQSQRSRFDDYVQRQGIYFANFRLEVAKYYATTEYLKETEKRITSHLLRIEEKLDSTTKHYQK